MKITVVLPAYREEENLRLLLPRINEAMQEAMKTSSGDYEILVVDTVKPLDSTEKACAQFGARYIQRRPSNLYGDAVRTAIAEASGEWIIFMDADGSHGPEWLPKLIAESAGGGGTADIVIASRYVEGGDTENPLALILMSRVLNITYAVVLGLRVKDVSNSFKVYRTALLKPLRLKCDDFDIIEEILFRICRANPDVRIREIPFTFKARMFGKTKRNLLLFVVSYVYTMLKLRFS
jgi:dolichol-phosphate mannosyltransferase